MGLESAEIDWIGDRNSAWVTWILAGVETRINHYIHCGEIPKDWIDRCVPEIDNPKTTGLFCRGAAGEAIVTKKYKELCEAAINHPLEMTDCLLYPSEHDRKKVKDCYTTFTLAISCLAFSPGGVELFGWKLEASFD
jgi:hypothetical protein